MVYIYNKVSLYTTHLALLEVIHKEYLLYGIYNKASYTPALSETSLFKPTNYVAHSN